MATSAYFLTIVVIFIFTNTFFLWGWVILGFSMVCSRWTSITGIYIYTPSVTILVTTILLINNFYIEIRLTNTFSINRFGSSSICFITFYTFIFSIFSTCCTREMARFTFRRREGCKMLRFTWTIIYFLI